MKKNKSLISVIIFFLSVFYTQLVCAAQLHPVDANGFTSALNRIENETKIVFFFTSWCPHCKNTINEILSNKKEIYQKVLFISLDKDYNKILKMTQYINNDINIYYMSNVEEIVSVFQRFNIKYSNSIPHISLLDENNNLIKDNINIRQLYRYLQ